MGGDYNLKVIVQRTVTMSMYWNFTCFFATTHFLANFVEFCKKRNFTESSQFIKVLHRVRGSAETPKLYYVIYEKPLITTIDPMIQHAF